MGIYRSIGVGTFEANKATKRLINKVLSTGRISYGPLSRDFEHQFSNLHGCHYGIVSNSGTSSLLVALQALKEFYGWSDGDEVIVPALTFVATVNVVLQLRLKPVLVDVEPDYYGIDAKKIKGAITNHTRCIIPVHTFGQPCNMVGVMEAVYDDDIKIIEDSCEAMFVKHHTIPVGAWGEIGCFSTYASHLIVTGVGGIAVTNHQEYARIMRSLCNHGMAVDDLTKQDNGYDPMRLGRDFIFDRIGHSFRITELEAALGLAQLETWPEMISKRQMNAAYLCSRLDSLQNRLQLPAVRPHTEHSWMMFPLVCKQEGVRDALTAYLNEHGIGTRRMLPLVGQPAYEGMWNPDDYPVAQWIDRNGFYIGVHQNLTQDDLAYIVQSVHDYYDTLAA